MVTGEGRECVQSGMQGGWGNLTKKVGKSDIIKVYGDSEILMQMRMFGDQIYGRSPGGASSAGMLQMQMMTE